MWTAWTIWMLAGCGGGQKLIYRPLDEGSNFEELDLFRERLEPETLEGPHATGSSVSFVATRRRDPPTAWTAATLHDEIAQVTAARPVEEGIEIELRFHRQGTTELFLFDGSGTVLDVISLSVRDPVEVQLLPIDDQVAGGGLPLGEVLHLVPGTRSGVAVSWLDQLGSPLSGGGLVQIDASRATPGAELGHAFDGQIDRLDVDIDETAPSGVFPVTFSAPTRDFVRQVEIHDRDEVDRVELVQRSFDEETARGTIVAEVYAGDDRMIGAPVEFSSTFDAPQQGTMVVWQDNGGGLPTLLTACFDTVCDTLEVPGEIVEISDGLAQPPSCGCAQPGSRWTLAPALFALLLARRRAAHSRTMVL